MAFFPVIMFVSGKIFLICSPSSEVAAREPNFKLVDGMLTQNSQPQVGGMLAQNSKSQPGEISTKHSKQNQKDSSCNNTGGISICENENSPQNKINYQPLLINHEIVNLPSASTIAIQRQELANRKQAPKALAILEDPVFTATDRRVAKVKG